MNKYRYIVTWSYSGNEGFSKIYKYRKSAFNFAFKIKFILKCADVFVEYQERKGEEWAMIGRW